MCNPNTYIHIAIVVMQRDENLTRVKDSKVEQGKFSTARCCILCCVVVVVTAAQKAKDAIWLGEFARELIREKFNCSW